jgi:16S rRNA G1207 methylase RsmC
VASFAGWQIFGAAGELDHEDGRIRMNIAAGARDTQAYLEQIFFQVNVLAKVNE